jgi:hypothetical protein
MSDAQNNERRAYYKHALEEAQAKLDAYSADHNGRHDLSKQVRQREAEEEVTTERQQQKLDLLHNRRCAWQLTDGNAAVPQCTAGMSALCQNRTHALQLTSSDHHEIGHRPADWCEQQRSQRFAAARSSFLAASRISLDKAGSSTALASIKAPTNSATAATALRRRPDFDRHGTALAMISISGSRPLANADRTGLPHRAASPLNAAKAAAGVSPDDLMITLYEAPGENFSFGRGKAQRANAVARA